MTALAAVHSQRFLRVCAWAFLFGWGLHGIDHMLRGMSASPMFVMFVGIVQGLIVVIALAMAFRGADRAPVAALVAGVSTTVVFTFAHLLPNFWPRFQDSFVSGPRTNVTWFSWVSALLDIGTGLLFAFAGMRAVKARHTRSPRVVAGCS